MLCICLSRIPVARRYIIVCPALTSDRKEVRKSDSVSMFLGSLSSVSMKLEKMARLEIFP